MNSLFNLANKFELLVGHTGLYLKKIEGHSILPVAPAGEQFLASLPSMVADGIFEESDGGFVAGLDGLMFAESRDVDPVGLLFDWSSLALRIEGRNSIGFDDFRYVPRFFLGKRVVQIRTVGIVGWRNASIFRIPAAQAIALSMIQEFNSASDKDKTKANTLDHLYRLKVVALPDSGIQFDEYLRSENVIKPEVIGLKAQDDGIRAIVYPTVKGISEEALKNQFLNISEVQDVYDLDSNSSLGRQRLIVSEELKEVLKAIKKNGFGLTGKAREEFYRNPRSLIPEGDTMNPDLVELVGFGPRVKGIGYAAFVRPISSTTRENWFGPGYEKDEKEKNPALSIECGYVDGEIKVIDFETREDAEDFLERVTANLAQGNESIEFAGVNIAISDPFARDLAAEVDRKSKSSDKKREAEKPRLLIHTNEDELDYVEPTSSITHAFALKLPESLKSDVVLKDHQKIGISWLGGLLSRDLSKGALLADDMGLGKTLQILTFLAWCIETELPELSRAEPPYEPILVVAPLILLENWETEMKRYFNAAVFSPYEKLHGSTLKKYRKELSSGREIAPGVETLDIEKIRSNRLIITNYETVKNYQYTFAKVPWSVVVIDEAQEIKEPSTAVTYALKVLNPTFRVASTGTPVETSLSNLWSIMDFAQPGNSLGSLRNFNKEFGEFSFDDPLLGSTLREALGFNTENGLILRRAKKDVLKDLPPKTVVEHDCILDDSLRGLFESVINFVQSSSCGSVAALQGLHQISQISQHPFLLENDSFRSDHKEYLVASSKLRKLMDILREIKGKCEKALVFTRSRKMQDILKSIFDAEFGIDTGIVNGETASRHKYVARTREGIIDRFSNKDGFNLLILSPEVAGVGLTITAGNHVIHYGRWWNPAKENQATDRAYRIGQTKSVSVHHLILKDPTGSIETFDEKLHRLLKAREGLADNFLAPSGDEGAVQVDLLGNLFGKRVEKQFEPNEASKADVARLSPYEFEAFVALVFKRRFPTVIVTPRSGDRGVDVVGISSTEIALIQCKELVRSLVEI